MRSFYAATETKNSSEEEFTSAEFNIFLEHKFNIIKSLILKLDDFKEQEKDEEPLLIICANYRKNHFLGKCPLSDQEVCKIFEDGHATEHCRSLPRLRKVLRESSKESNQPLGITKNPTPSDTWNNYHFLEQVP